MHVNDCEIMPAIITAFDANPEVQQMIDESEQAIEKGQVYSTKQGIEMIKSGEI